MDRRRMILLLTNSSDATSDYLEGEIASAGIELVRYDTDKDLQKTQFSYSNNHMLMQWRNVELRPEDVSHVVYRRPKPFLPNISGDKFQVQHVGDEWAEVWESFLAEIPFGLWINHPSRNFESSHKIEQLSRAKKSGLQVPQTIVTSIPGLALDFFRQFAKGVIVKPLASGYIERDAPEDDTIIYTRAFQEDDIKIIDRIKSCPVMFQERIDKSIDVRLTALDGQMVAVGLKAYDVRGEQRLDIRRYNMADVVYEEIEIPLEVQAKVKTLINSYDIRFAAIDFAIDIKGEWIFFEINPNGQWAWMDLCAEFRIIDLFKNSFV